MKKLFTLTKLSLYQASHLFKNPLKCLLRNLIFFTLSAFGLNAMAQGSVDFKSANERAAKSIYEIYSQCSDRIWSGYNLKDLDIIFVDRDQDEVVEVSMLQNQIRNRKKAEFFNAPIESAFSFFKNNNKNIMSINIRNYYGSNSENLSTEKVFERAFRLALHEAFHGTMQRTWVRKKRGARGTFVPIESAPRIYRSLIYKNLLEASAGKAKFWYNKWKSEYPHEEFSSMDREEGSARFVDDRAWALLQAGGCSAEEESVQRKHVEIITKKSDASLDGRYFSLDVEAYSLGSAALSTLKAADYRIVFEEVANGESPLSAVLKRVNSIADSYDDAWSAKFTETQKEQSKYAEEILATTYAAINSAELVILSVPKEWYRYGDDESSVGYENFFLDHQRSIQFSVYSEAVESGSPDRSSKLTASANAVGMQFENLEAPCRTPFELYAVKRSELRKIGENFELNNPLLKGVFQATEKKAQTGETFLCLGE